MNYNKEVTAYKEYKEFFNNCAISVLEFREKHNILCHIKNGTLLKSNI